MAVALAQVEAPAPAAPGHFDDDDANWGYTKSAQEVARIRQEIERQAGRKERHTIGRDTPLAEGVYEGSYGGEAIVVNLESEPDTFNYYYELARQRAINQTTGQIDKSLIMQSVFDTVRATMRYDQAAVDNIFQRGLKGRNGAKIALSAYINEGVGVCRHQALFAGALLERFKVDGLVRGQVSVDRNMVRRSSDMDDKYDGHAWVRYTNSVGNVFIIDVAQKKIDSLENLMAQRAANPSTTWEYARPEDKVNAQQVGQPVQSIQPPTPVKPFDLRDYMNEDGVIDRVPWEK